METGMCENWTRSKQNEAADFCPLGLRYPNALWNESIHTGGLQGPMKLKVLCVQWRQKQANSWRQCSKSYLAQDAMFSLKHVWTSKNSKCMTVQQLIQEKMHINRSSDGKMFPLSRYLELVILVRVAHPQYPVKYEHLQKLSSVYKGERSC